MSNIRSLSEYRRRKKMTPDEKLKELEEVLSREIDQLYALVSDIRLEVALLKAKWNKEVT